MSNVTMNIMHYFSKTKNPVFADHNDQLALLQLQNVFKDREIIDIDCQDLDKFGCVLNCATWNIAKK